MSTLKTTNLQNADASSANIVLGQGSGGGATITGVTTITSNDAGATGPTLQLTHDSSSPADNDIIGIIAMDGDDDAGNATEFSSIYTKVTDVSNGSETGHIAFKTRALGSYNEILRLAARSSASAPSYTTDDHNGIILDVYNTGNPYPRYMNFIAKSAGDTDSNIGFWTESVGGSPTEKMRLTNGGQLLIGRTSAGNTGDGHTLRGTDSVIFSRDSDSGETVQISRNTNDAIIVQFRAGNSGNATQIGHIDKSGSGVTYNSDSDYRKKENDVVISDGITKLKQLRPIRFNFKDNPDKTFDGFFAHEVHPVVPEIVTGTKDAVVTQDDIDNGDYQQSEKDDPKYQSMDYGRLTPLLTAALQEAIAEIETLKTKVAALESS